MNVNSPLWITEFEHDENGEEHVEAEFEDLDYGPVSALASVQRRHNRGVQRARTVSAAHVGIYQSVPKLVW